MVPGVVEHAVPGVKKEVLPKVERQSALSFFWLTSIASVPAFVSIHRQHAGWEWALTRPQPPLAMLAYKLYYLWQSPTLLSSSSSAQSVTMVCSTSCVYCGNLRAMCCVLLKIKISMLRH